jgi:hypothetical protein
MKTRWIVLLVAALTPLVIVGGLAQTRDFRPMFVAPLTGTLRIQQNVPCASNVNQTTPVIAGRTEISPADGIDVPGGKQFTLTRASVFFDGFTISRSCLGFGETRAYTEVGVQLGQAVTFTGFPTAPGIYDATIPKENLFIYQAAIVNGQSEAGYRHPKEPATATINLNDGTVQMHIAVGTKIHIERCALGVCPINGDYSGTLTADLAGTIIFSDSDGDGILDKIDNCKLIQNPSQAPVATPIVTPPAALTINSCQDDQIGLASGSDVCDATIVSLTNNAPAVFTVGPNVVTWTGVDGKGRVGSATQNVTVVDTTKPIFTFVPGPIALNDCKAADLGLPTATDDCAGTPTFTNNAPAIFPVGPTVVTWTARDASGNQSTATQTVTVTDTVAPTVSCVPASPPGGSFRVSGVDACGAPTIRLGSFVLASGEQIKINEVGKSGVKVSTNAPLDRCFADACSSGGTPTPGFVDPRRVPEAVVWQDLIGVSAAGNNLTKTSPTSPNPNLLNAGAASTQQFARGDGYVEFSAAETNLTHLLGLSAIPAGCPLPCADTDPSQNDVGFGIVLNLDGRFYVVESGTLVAGPGPQGSFGTYTAGERFRVSLSVRPDGSAKVAYGRIIGACTPGAPCNETVFHFSTATPPHYPFCVDAAFREINATLTDVRVVRIQ